MQICNKRLTQVTTNIFRRLVKPVSMKVEDDHTHIAVPTAPIPKTLVSMSKQLIRNNALITTRLNSK